MGIAEVFEYIDDGNFKKADSLCHELVSENPEDAAVYVAMLMIEMQARNANQIKINLHMYADSENYKNAVRYDDGRFAELLKFNKRKAKKPVSRKKKKWVTAIGIVLVVAVLGAGYVYLLPEVNYYRAEKYYSEGNYSKASDIFKSLGKFKNSCERYEDAVLKNAGVLYEAGETVEALLELDKIGKGSTDRVLELRYDCAMHAMNSMNFEEAASAFEILGDFQDSEQKFHNCNLYSACSLSDIGDRDGAVRILRRIGLDEDDMFDMKYDHGNFLSDHMEYYDAKLHYAVLGDYRDCIMKIVYIDSIAGETMYTVTENPDNPDATVGVFSDYSEAFEALSVNENCHIYDDKGIMYY